MNIFSFDLIQENNRSNFLAETSIKFDIQSLFFSTTKNVSKQQQKDTYTSL